MTFQKGNRKAGKLTGEKALEIREKYARIGVTQRALALEYGVSINTIASVVNGLTWRDVAYETVVKRPPLNSPPSNPSDDTIAASTAKLFELLDEPSKFRIPDLDATEPTGEGMNRFEREASKLKPSLSKKVGDELDKLEKGKGD